MTLMTFDKQSNGRRIEVESQFCSFSIRFDVASYPIGSCLVEAVQKHL